MKFSDSLIVILSIFGFIDNTISLEIWLQKEDSITALALIKKRDSTIQLAIPHKYQNDLAAYSINDPEDENELADKFVAGCPARPYAIPYYTETYLKQKSNLLRGSQLFTMHEYDTNRTNLECSSEMDPSIKKEENKDSNDNNTIYCGQLDFEAEMYSIGYPDVQFMTIYEMCYSLAEDKGIIYTIHRIVSPNLLLQKLWEFYIIDPKLTHKSVLDKKRSEIESQYTNQYAYHFVGFDDMPTRSWEHATWMKFNYMPIPKNKDLLTGMIAADNFIRLFSKETNKPLTLYSGPYQITKNISSYPCMGKICKPKPTQINSLWRLIMDEKGHAVIMITQHTPIKCDDHYICDQNMILVREYKKGGCTYLCPANDKIIKKLGLPELDIKGDLTLKFPQKISTEGQPSDEKNFKDISISNFMKKGNFMTALTEADADLAKNVQLQNAKDSRGYLYNKDNDSEEDKSDKKKKGTGCFNWGGGGKSSGSSWFMYDGGGGGYGGADAGGDTGGCD